jgi:hypothetical protein
MRVDPMTVLLLVRVGGRQLHQLPVHAARHLPLLTLATLDVGAVTAGGPDRMNPYVVLRRRGLLARTPNDRADLQIGESDLCHQYSSFA